MANPVIFVLRAAFLAYLALNAWNAVADLRHSHPRFAKHYASFAKELVTSGAKLPYVLTAEFIKANSEAVVKHTAWAQIVLCALALFVSRKFTMLAGLLYALHAVVRLNAAKISAKSTTVELEPYVLALSVLAASFAFSFAGQGVIARVIGKKNK